MGRLPWIILQFPGITSIWRKQSSLLCHCSDRLSKLIWCSNLQFDHHFQWPDILIFPWKMHKIPIHHWTAQSSVIWVFTLSNVIYLFGLNAFNSKHSDLFFHWPRHSSSAPGALQSLQYFLTIPRVPHCQQTHNFILTYRIISKTPDEDPYFSLVFVEYFFFPLHNQQKLATLTTFLEKIIIHRYSYNYGSPHYNSTRIHGDINPKIATITVVLCYTAHSLVPFSYQTTFK